MPLIANLTLAQLRLATKAQIITAIANYLTDRFSKRQLIAFLLDADIVTDPPARSYAKDGQPASETIIDRDAETGAAVITHTTRWTYYPTGEVDTITLSDLSAATGEETARTIKHYVDGRQPQVTRSIQVPVVSAESAKSVDRIPTAAYVLIALSILAALAAITLILFSR